MKGYVYADAEGRAQVYYDRKRAWWQLSVVYPLFPVIAIAAHVLTGSELGLLVPIVFSYGLGPLIDAWLGEDESNPPEEVVPALERDRYYRILTYLTVPLHFVSLIAAAVWAGTQGLSPWAWLVLAITAGLSSGLGINTAHELGHKSTKLERVLARWALAVPAYGHFCVEHNLGHHRDVATPEDPASARMGESIYRFALREIPGAIRRGWQTEAERLRKRGLPVVSLHNEIVQSYVITALLQGGLIVAFGPAMILFLAIHNVVAWWQLTSANYIEHYGLLRQRGADGRYERCQPHHSWNSNHTFTNLLLFHLERHSDHHAHAGRRYQSLRHFDDVPRLPNGYFGMYLVAYVPWLWYRVMDRRVLALPHIDGDLSRVNLEPTKRSELIQRYG